VCSFISLSGSFSGLVVSSSWGVGLALLISGGLLILVVFWEAVDVLSDGSEGNNEEDNGNASPGELVVEGVLLAGPGVTLSVFSETVSELVRLVDESQVADVPDHDQDVGNQRLDHGGGQGSSGSAAVQSVPTNEEADTNESWQEENDINEWVPPWQGEVEELEVGGKELLECDSPDDQSNKNDSSLDWQAAAAVLVLGVNVTALAKAAAEGGSNWLSLDGSVRGFSLVHQSSTGVGAQGTDGGGSSTFSGWLFFWLGIGWGSTSWLFRLLRLFGLL